MRDEAALWIAVGNRRARAGVSAECIPGGAARLLCGEAKGYVSPCYLSYFAEVAVFFIYIRHMMIAFIG
jgi:hypothetical protein